MNDHNGSGASIEMPKYKCHKEVWALKIKKILPREISGGITIVPEDAGYGEFDLDQAYADKFKPEEGGYYVMYKGGYESYSPADAFEEGYARI